MLNILRNDNQHLEESSEKKRSNSQRKYQKAPDIITQVNKNSIIQQNNPHQSAFTPSNRSNKLNSQKLLLPPKSAEFSEKKTLILDLDETLVHSSFTPFEKNDIILNVDFEGVMYNIYVLVRPDAELFLKKVGKIFEVVIFTASISKYASPLLDILDKEKNIKHRLYRDHCTFINGIYIKDLKKCNRSLKHLMIVDNSPIAYTFDPCNGLPIKTWIEDSEDKELMKLYPILEFLSKTKDVRIFIDKFVYNNKILYDEAMELISMCELIDKKNNSINNDINNKNNINVTHNLKVIQNEKKEDSSLNEEKNNKEEVNNNNNNIKNNNITNEMEIKNRNNELKLNLINKDNNTSSNTQNSIPENGYNTTKNVNKLINNIHFNDKDINIKKINTNVNNTNNDAIINTKKINKIKPNNQKQNKKNIFRNKAVEQQPQQNKIGINNIIFSNKFDPSLPLTLLLSNIAKGLFTSKSSNQIKNNKEINKKKQKVEKNNLNQILLKDTPNERNNANKKFKYINLLEKYKGNNKVTMSLINSQNNPNKKKLKNNYSMKNMNSNKPSNLRVSSSISSYHGYGLGNKNNIYKEKNGTSYNRVTKSKSTENFLLYSNKNKHPKTPKEQYRQRVVMNNKKIINILDGINYTKATKNKNNNNKESYRGIYKMKMNKNIK